MLSWKNQWKDIHIVEGIFLFQKTRREKNLKGLGLCAPTRFTQSESHTCSEPCCTPRHIPQMLLFELWVVINWFLRGMNRTEQKVFAVGSQSLGNTRCLHTDVLADTIFQTFVLLPKQFKNTLLLCTSPPQNIFTQIILLFSCHFIFSPRTNNIRNTSIESNESIYLISA